MKHHGGSSPTLLLAPQLPALCSFGPSQLRPGRSPRVGHHRRPCLLSVDNHLSHRGRVTGVSTRRRVLVTALHQLLTRYETRNHVQDFAPISCFHCPDVVYGNVSPCCTMTALVWAGIVSTSDPFDNIKVPSGLDLPSYLVPESPVVPLITPKS